MHTEHGRQRWDLILKGFRRRYELCLEEPKIVYEAKGKKIFQRRNSIWNGTSSRRGITEKQQKHVYYGRGKAMTGSKTKNLAGNTLFQLKPSGIYPIGHRR